MTQKAVTENCAAFTFSIIIKSSSQKLLMGTAFYINKVTAISIYQNSLLHDLLYQKQRTHISSVSVKRTTGFSILY